MGAEDKLPPGVRIIAPDLTGTDQQLLPQNSSQLKKWRKLIEERLSEPAGRTKKRVQIIAVSDIKTQRQGRIRR